MCLGTFRVGKAMEKSTSFILMLQSLFNVARQVLVSGYNKDNLSPANKHLHDSMYDKFKISDKVSEEQYIVLDIIITIIYCVFKKINLT